ncbi:DNA-binding transcriptional LysR family regulator [Crossiella equi]|uniref:DNA-binding transcriptional LysR family regulator n=1 Tax=Crossiella equi TaxID=130796 RepID=A0ABS5AJA2_9PSEU|nr:LysR family transcriptional regulator [Crossiella equi]MBP2476466.1 DNA-binding transcriptional LysR family regulator [Crossiella equi]
MNELPEPLVSALAPRLELLRALAEHGHVTRAAQSLGVPQPTVTRWVAELGRKLGAPLTSRDGRGIRLTRAGRLLAEAAGEALSVLEAGCRRAAEEVDPERGHVSLGFLHVFGRSLVPELLRSFRAEHPGIRFSLSQAAHDTVVARVVAGELDLALTAAPPRGYPDGLCRVPVQEQALVAVLPEAHRLAGRPEIAVTDLAGEDFVQLEPGFGLRLMTDELCAAAGFTPRIAFEGQETETLRGLVSAGLGVALLPASEHVPPPGVVELPLRPGAVRTIELVWLAEDGLSPAVRTFRDFVLRGLAR